MHAVPWLDKAPVLVCMTCLVNVTRQVHVLYSQDAPLASMLASPGELQALSLACELSSNLDALLSGLSGLEQLMLPAIDADTACGGLGCLSTLTRLTGTHSGVSLAVAGRSQHHMSD